MKLFVVILVISVSVANCQFSPFRTIFEKLHEGPPPPLVQYRNNIHMKYIEQKLDHFDESEKRTWRMV